MAKKVYETAFCNMCKYRNKQCQMRRLDETPFDINLAYEFPNVPMPLDALSKFAKPKVKVDPIFGLSKFTPIVGNKYSYTEISIITPLTNLGIGKKNRMDIHDHYPLTPTVGLAMTAKDSYLHEFIQAREIKTTWAEELAKRQYDFVLAPNISFYYNQPSCAIVYNRFLSYKVIKELLSAGLPVIPSVNFLWEEDLKEYAKWLNTNRFDSVYFNMQMAKYDSVFEKALESIKLLNKYIDAEIILLGVFDPDRIVKLEKIREFIYVSSQLHILSTKRVEWKAGKETKLDQFDAMYYEDVMQRNIQNYRSELRRKGVW